MFRRGAVPEFSSLCRLGFRVVVGLVDRGVEVSERRGVLAFDSVVRRRFVVRDSSVLAGLRVWY